MRGLILTIFFLLFACRADDRNYHTPYSQNNNGAVIEPEGEAVSVSLENLPKIKDSSVNINIGVTSKNGAVTYKYALLTGNAAKGGSSACASADYGEFIPLTQTIKHNRLPENHHLICAKGKDISGITQQMPTTFSWIIDTSITVDDTEEVGQPDEGESSEVAPPPTETVVKPPAPAEPPEEKEESIPIPNPVPNPPMPNPVPNLPAPTMPMQAEIKISEDNGGERNRELIAFSNGETRKVSIYVHNKGTAPLNWRMQSDSSSAIKWLQAEYNGRRVEQIPDSSEEAIFSGTVAAGSKSAALSFSLETGGVLDEYLEYGDPVLYRERFVFYDDDNNTSVDLIAYFYIPKLSLGNENPRLVNGEEKSWQLSLPKDKIGTIYTVYANNRGRGSLSWQALRHTGSGANKQWFAIGSSWTTISNDSEDNWFSVRARDTYIEIKLNNSAKQKKLNKIDAGSGGKDGWRGSWNWIVFSSNGGRSYSSQSVAGRRYFKVCFEEKEGEHKNECGNEGLCCTLIKLSIFCKNTAIEGGRSACQMLTGSGCVLTCHNSGCVL